VSGVDYLTYMQKNVFGPTDMTNTGVKPATDDITIGHMLRNDKLVAISTHFNAGDYGVPSGSLQTTLADFVKLSNALYQNTLLSATIKQTMLTPYHPHSNTPGWHSWRG
jgi:CubicO group peptidase (beta-lactamase class C family)